jgi:hypothetical protein
MNNDLECSMIYSFICPRPCDREIIVKAKNKYDAIDKIIMAGAISCRNRGSRCSCEKTHFAMPPMPIDQLKNIVGLCMQEVCEA